MCSSFRPNEKVTILYYLYIVLKTHYKCFLLGLFWDFYFDIALVVRERLMFVFFSAHVQTAEMRSTRVCLYFLNP